jgi:hypothetical protein
MKNTSNTFCILPWIHLSTRPNGTMRVCCQGNASGATASNKQFNPNVGLLKDDDSGLPVNLKTTDFLTGWNSKYMRDIRKAMLAGDKPLSCMKCYKEEATGFYSKRQWETDYWIQRVDVESLINNTDETGSVPPQVAYIDLRFGNKCQLACVMCSPHDSSGWIKDFNKIFPDITNNSLKGVFNWDDKSKINGASFNWHKNNPVFWEQLFQQIPNMQQLYFAGGESLIIDEHYTILEECIRQGHAKNLELRYNSNGIEWRNDLFDLWKHFKLVRFHLSIDDLFERNDYIRYPSKWNRIEEVVHILDKETTDNVEVTIACAVQFLNVYYLTDFIRWKLEQNFNKINMHPQDGGGIAFHFVYMPPHLNVKVLPSWFKQIVREKYEAFIPWWEENWHLGVKDGTNYETWRKNESGLEKLNGILSFMESEDWSERLPETKQYIMLLDSHRDQDFYETFPHMKNIFS